MNTKYVLLKFSMHDDFRENLQVITNSENFDEK